MEVIHKRLSFLIQQYLRGIITDAEKAELMQLVTESEENRKLFDQLSNDEYLFDQLLEMENIDDTGVWEKIEKMLPPEGLTAQETTTEAPFPKPSKRNWLKLAAAAVIIIVISVACYYWFRSSPENKPVITGNKPQVKTNFSYLQNENGIQVSVLDTTYRLTLPDSSLVLLNKHSTIRFPPVFTGNKRQVELNGMAYFDIKPGKPFHLIARDKDIVVLGTKFQVEAYDSTKLFRTSLFEGKLVVKQGKDSYPLNPGQKIESINDSQLNISTADSMQQALSWQRSIDLNDATIEEVVAEVEQIYGVDIIISGTSTKRAIAGFSPGTELNEVLQTLQKLYDVQLSIKN